MKIFDGLSSGQAILLDTGSYVVQLNDGDYLINGTEFSVTYSTGQIIVEDISKIERVQKIPGKVLGYKTTKDGLYAELTVEQMLHMSDELDEKFAQYYDDVEEEFDFPDIDTEYAYKKQQEIIRSYSQVRSEATKELAKVEIEVVGNAVDTGSPFIVSAYSVGATSFSNGGVFRVDLSGVAAHEFEQLKSKYSSDKFTNATHTNIRYAQINGSYIFTDEDFGVRDNVYRVTTSLEEAKNLGNKVRGVVRNKVRIKVAPKTVDKEVLTTYNVLNSLNSIRNIVRKLDVKTKSSSDHYVVKGFIDKLIETVEGIK